MNREERIRNAVDSGLSPLELFVENESHRHSVPVNSETHFKVLVVADLFQGLSRIARQRKVMDLLSAEFQSGLHALAIRALTKEEWDLGQGEGFVSPACRGGSKR